MVSNALRKSIKTQCIDPDPRLSDFFRILTELQIEFYNILISQIIAFVYIFF